LRFGSACDNPDENTYELNDLCFLSEDGGDYSSQKDTDEEGPLHEPVGVPAALLTVAVNVTDWPKTV
jgi:hypothetical protein